MRGDIVSMERANGVGVGARWGWRGNMICWLFAPSRLSCYYNGGGVFMYVCAVWIAFRGSGIVPASTLVTMPTPPILVSTDIALTSGA